MRKSSFILLLAASTVILLLTYLQSYTLSDDVLYHCIWRRFENEDFIPIRSFSDIIQSQIVHYQYLTGRAVVQTVAQTFLGLLNKPIFNIANSIVFGLTAWTAARFVSGNKITPLVMMTVLFIMIVMIPGFVDDYLWIEGSLNYLWVSLAVMWFIIIFEKKKTQNIRVTDYLLSPFMLLIGWTHEGMTLPLTISLIAHFWFRRKTVMSNAAIPYIAWFTAGSLICSFAPSTIMRAFGDETHITVDAITKIALGLFTCTEMRTVWLLAFVMAYTYKKDRRLFFSHIRRYDYLYLSVVLCMGIIFVSGVTQPRVCYGVEFYAMLIVVNLLLKLGITKYAAKLTAIMGIILVVVLIPGIYYSYKGHCNYKYMMTQIKEGKSDIIRVKPVMGNDYFIRKFTFRQVEFSPNTYYFAPDSTDENVRCAATLLDRERLLFLPDDMVENIMNNPDSYMRYGENIAGEMFAMQIPKGTKVNKITFILGEDNPPFYKRPFMYKGDTYEAKRWQAIEINGRQFVFFDKPFPKIARRIKDIKIS